VGLQATAGDADQRPPPAGPAQGAPAGARSPSAASPAQQGPGGAGAVAAASPPPGAGRSGAASGGVAPAPGGDYFVPWHIPLHRADAARALAGLQARGAPSPSAPELQGEGAARAAAAPEAGVEARSGESSAGPRIGRPRAPRSHGDGGRQPAQASDTAVLSRGRDQSRRGAPQEACGAVRSEQDPDMQPQGDGQHQRLDAGAPTEAAPGGAGCARDCHDSDRAPGASGSAADWAAATPEPGSASAQAGAGVLPRDAGAGPASEHQPSPDGRRRAPSPDEARRAGRPATPWAVDAGKRAVVVQRYCHLYGAGELEALVRSLPGAAVASSCYDRSNWCVVRQMGRPPDAPAA